MLPPEVVRNDFCAPAWFTSQWRCDPCSKLEKPVKEIRVTGGNVQGIVLDNGQEIDAPVVIFNIDTRTTFKDLLKPDLVPTS